MDARQAALWSWSEAHVGAEGEWQPVTADASSRRYFRLVLDDRSVICADAPPDTEKNDAFLAVRDRLAAASLPVPALLAADLEQGFLLLEDLGDCHLQQVLELDSPTQDYLGALPLLHEIQAVAAADLPPYDRALLTEEYSRFYQWFCRAFLELEERPHDRSVVEAFGELLVEDALSQPQVFVYRDYHCRNLLQQPGGGLGLIDFQDAVHGPLCYDLASLLKDCYLRWDPDQVEAWALAFRAERLARGLEAAGSDAAFLRWFHWIGLHRHLKVLGNFTRLALRDGKPGYLADIPLVLEYIGEVLPRYPEFAGFSQWWDRELAPRLRDRDWGAAV